MDEDQYWIKSREIKRKNHRWFAGIVGGLAALTIGAGIYMRSPNISDEQKKDIYNYACNISQVLVLGTTTFFIVKESEQLRKLNDEYEKSNKKKR